MGLRSLEEMISTLQFNALSGANSSNCEEFKPRQILKTMPRRRKNALC
jgi:hypothetical protein